MDFCDSPIRHAHGSILPPRRSRWQKGIAWTSSGDNHKRLDEFPRREAGNQYLRTGSLRNKIRLRPQGPHRSESPQLNPLGPHPGPGFSRQLLADLRFGGLPIHKLSFSFGDSLSAFIEDVFVPCRRLNGFRRTDEFLPKQLHRSKFLLESHLF